MSTSEATAAKIGHFCWTDLASSDSAKAEKFYTELFGWSAMNIDMGGGRSYTMFKCGEDEVCGVYEMSPQQKQLGFPSFWTSYVLVEDIDGKVAGARLHGATVLVEPFDMGEKGRMAVLQDPTGAIFAMWQDGNSPSVKPSGIGSLCWFELMSLDVDVANIFYSSLFQWKKKSAEMPGMEYFMLNLGEESVGGMMTLPEEAKENGAPPHWLFYVEVADCDQTVEKALSLGAEIRMSATDFANVGRGAILADPTGGGFGVFQLQKSEG